MSDTPPPGCSVPPGELIDLSGAAAVVVTPEDVARAAALLGRAADRVREATVHLLRATADPLRLLDPGSTATLAWDQAQAVVLAGQLDSLATRTAATARVYAGADDDGARLAGAVGSVLGDHPALLLPAALLAAQGVATLLGAELVAGRLTGQGGSADEAWTRTTGVLTEDGRAAVLTSLLAGVVQGLGPGVAPPQVDVHRVAAGLRLATGTPPPAVTVPLDEAPQLPAPTGLAQVAGAVKAAAADERTGVILVQRVTGPDGATSWLVAIPGTQSGGFGGDTVTDMSTNLALDGGLPDQMTGAVLDAMAQAGIGPDDPVVLAGHSQGGMTAQSVAVAAGTAYSIRSVVTFGSPTIPQPMPSGVRLFALEQQQEAVNGLDGAAGTRTAPGVVVIRGDAATAATGPTPGPVAAHSMDGYAALARKADEAFAAADRQVPGLPVADSGPVTDSGDGGAGGGAASGAAGPAVQVSTQAFRATRDPAVVAAAVPTMSAAP